MTDKETDMKLLREHVNALIEHFDTVQIFTTRHMPMELDGTIKLNLGAGNWFARYGQVKDYIIVEEESMRDGVRDKS